MIILLMSTATRDSNRTFKTTINGSIWKKIYAGLSKSPGIRNLVTRTLKSIFKLLMTTP